MKNIWYFIKKLSAFRGQLCIGIILTFMLSISSITLMSLSGWFISSSAFAGLTLSTALAFNYLIPAGTIRFLALIRILSRYGERVINHDFTFKILTQLRVWFYTCLIPLSPAHLMEKRSGDLLNQATHDIDTLDHLYLRVISPCIIAILITLGVSFFFAFYSHKLALIVFTMFLITIVFIPIISLKNGLRVGRKLIDATSELRTQSIDAIQGLIPLLFYVPSNIRFSKIQIASNNLLQLQKRMWLLKAFINSSITLLSGLTIWLVLIIGIPLVNHTFINGAQFAMILLCIIIAFEQIQTLPLAFLSIGKSQLAATRLLDLSKQTPTIEFPKITSKNSTNNIDIIFDNVDFKYPSRPTPVLNNISLHIPQGSKVVITGPSGAGKSTLAYLLSRVWNPTSGKIRLAGLPLDQYSEHDLRKHISLVPQRIHIFNATVRDNLTLMNNKIPDNKLYHVLNLVGLDEMVKQLPKGLKTYMGDFGKHFSGGQIRRIGIARALLTDTPIQIWDEPSTGLNQELVEHIWHNCKEVLDKKTVIIITHDATLLKKATKIIDIENGTLKNISDIIQP